MTRVIASVVLSSLVFASTASATTFTFNTDPFAGSTALTTPGRQIVGGETFITFNPLTDNFALGVPGVGGTVEFANDIIANLPAGNVNVIVLRTFDDDANTGTAFGAGNAANLIAGQLTSPGPGFFIYFNSTLDVPRLVYSTNLDDNTADLKVLFRMTNLAGAPGRAALADFTESNFAFVASEVPEPSSVTLMGAGLLAAWLTMRRRRSTRRG